MTWALARFWLVISWLISASLPCGAEEPAYLISGARVFDGWEPSPADARAFVAGIVSEGADFIKIVLEDASVFLTDGATIPTHSSGTTGRVAVPSPCELGGRAMT